MTDPGAWAGPGVILDFCRVFDTSNVAESTLEKWFVQQYAPGLLATGAVKAALAYRAANSAYDKQRLFVYQISDLAAVHEGKLRGIARTRSRDFFDGELDDHLEYESRIYSLVQVCETEERDKEAADTIILVMMQPPPGGELELDLWYRDEHNKQMSREPGWLRTTRFKLLLQHGNQLKESEELSFLAIHEFGEGNALGADFRPLEPMSEWTKKVMGEAKAIDAAVYRKCKLVGEET